jgi:acyl-CoA reductase-like NAD-dependent aldehyde dehydrogenase
MICKQKICYNLSFIKTKGYLMANVNEARVFLGSSEVVKEKSVEIKSPYDGEVVTVVSECGVDDAKEAVAIAKEAFEACSKSPLSQRIAWLEDVVEYITQNKEEFAQSIAKEVAKPIAFARVEVDRCIETIKLTAMELVNLGGHTIPTDVMPSGKKTMAYYKREPLGVVVAITPFNFPLNLVAHKIAPALGVGNSVVLKPTPEAPYTAYLLAKAFISSKYAIKDALSVVYGDAEVGSALVKHPDVAKISFTGSVPVGNIIIREAGIKKVTLELGGNAATYIDKSANIAQAATKCAFGAFVNSGQVCISLQRIYVHRDIYDEFAKQMVEQTSRLKVGSPYDDDTFMGPLINDESKQRAFEWIQSAVNEGAKIAVGGCEIDGAFAPTVMIDVKDDMNIVCQEVFAPIVSLVAVDEYDEAIEKMNDSEYGLQYSIFSNDLSQTYRFVDDAKCGGVVVNDIPTLRFDVQPYGGVKLSGIGREGPKFALEEFTQIKSVAICA